MTSVLLTGLPPGTRASVADQLAALTKTLQLPVAWKKILDDDGRGDHETYGWAFLNFNTSIDAQSAIEKLSGYKFGAHTLNASLGKKKNEPVLRDSFAVVITNMMPAAHAEAEKSLVKLLRAIELDDVKGRRIPVNDDGGSYGKAILYFSSNRKAADAVELLNGCKFDSCVLKAFKLHEPVTSQSQAVTALTTNAADFPPLCKGQRNRPPPHWGPNATTTSL